MILGCSVRWRDAILRRLIRCGTAVRCWMSRTDAAPIPRTSPPRANGWRRNPGSLSCGGAALLIRRSLIDRIGGLDDGFFAYCEDIDYSIRSIDAGFRNVLVEDAVVYHDEVAFLGGGLFRDRIIIITILRNNFMLMSKHSRRWRGLKGKLWYTKRVLRRLEQPEGSAAEVRGAILLALWDIWRGVSGRFDPRRRMPWPLRPMLDARPGFWRRLLEVV